MSFACEEASQHCDASVPTTHEQSDKEFVIGILMKPTIFPDTPYFTSFSFWSICNFSPKYSALYGCEF